MKFDIYKKIPLNIFQFYKNENDKINGYILKEYNKEFNYFLFNEIECEKFIYNFFSLEIYNTYISLIPLEYKIDLWKYCILYKYGGIFIDNDLFCNIKLINLIDNNLFTYEKDYYYNINIIYTGFIITKEYNKIFLILINEIVNNVKNKFYGKNFTYPTGSGLLTKIFNNHNIKSYLYYDGYNILYKNQIIMRKYYNIKRSEKYKSMWISKKIYEKNEKLLLK
jgi:mannosyltransferase OCH1-like enzyme